MPRYRDTFKLDPADVEVIEAALRGHAASRSDDPHAGDARVVNEVLGRLHAQKIFFSHARTEGTPNG